MTADRVIGTVCSRDGYAGFMDVLRRRGVELNTTYEGIDDLAGLPLRYTSRLFAPVPLRSIGPQSFGPLLGALGLKLVIVEDTALMAKVTNQLSRKASSRVYASGGMLPKRRRRKSRLLGNREWSLVMNGRRYLLTNPEQRSAVARKAAKARWRKKR